MNMQDYSGAAAQNSTGIWIYDVSGLESADEYDGLTNWATQGHQ